MLATPTFVQSQSITQTCDQGAITRHCSCAGSVYNEGYCCSGRYQDDPCMSSSTTRIFVPSFATFLSMVIVIVAIILAFISGVVIAYHFIGD